MRCDENGNSVKAIGSDLLNSLRPRKQAFDYDVEYLLDFMLFKDMINFLETQECLRLNWLDNSNLSVFIWLFGYE